MDSAGVLGLVGMLGGRVVRIPFVALIGLGAERLAQAGVIEPLLTSTIWAHGR